MDKIGGENQLPGKTTETSAIVKCDVCGKSFNRHHLSSHKRRAHGQSNNPALAASEEAKVVETILALYRQLSAASRTNVLERLTSLS